jgi:DNA-binding LacI/PurR family transcriptional regulator
MATIKEVADLAGVSIGTVSHVITGSVRVSEPLRLNVHAAIRKLNYYPNHIARSLKTRKTRTLGIMVPDLTIPYFPKLIRGAEAAARAKDYWLIAVNSEDNEHRQRDLLSLLHSQRVEGILLVVAAAPIPANQIARMVEGGMWLVCLDRIPDRVPVDSVSVDDSEAGKLGIEHLIQQGYRRIATATGPQALKSERQRLRGCKLALHEAGLSMQKDLVWFGNLRPKDVAELCRARLKSGVPRPDAIFSTNGPTGLGVLRAMRDCGLRTPDDLAFVTIDELACDDLLYPSITTVVQPAYDIGWRAAQILLDRIENTLPEGQSETIRLHARLKLGDSSRRS